MPYLRISVEVFEPVQARREWPRPFSRTKGKTARRGFTLIELMMVVVIISLLLAVVVPRLVGRTERARVAATKMSIENTSTALRGFELDLGHFPTTEEGLEALVTRPASLTPEDKWEGPYLTETPEDAWKRPLIYKCPAEKAVDFDLYSVGADGQEDTEDDIVNYRKRE